MAKRNSVGSNSNSLQRNGQLGSHFQPNYGTAQDVDEDVRRSTV